MAPARRRARALSEVPLVVPDARSESVRRRVASGVARLDRGAEDEALRWAEAVSEFDARDASSRSRLTGIAKRSRGA
jgi:hypothetical protein